MIFRIRQAIAYAIDRDAIIKYLWRAMFFADIISAYFQMYSLRWIGGTDDPDAGFHPFE